MTETAYFTTLKNRGLIHLEGEDRHDFLQGLISNDIKLLQPGKALYACLLSPQGKFLHDFFITEGNGFTLIECEGGERAQDLYKKLSMYRLRSKVTISVEDNVPVYAIIGHSHLGIRDPRHPDLGGRSFEKPDLPEKPFEAWDEHRIRLTVPDGSRDMIPGSSTLLECNIDRLNGISWDKGCYIGQELTARMHYRALVKKRLQTVKLDELPENTDLRSNCNNIGLALLKTNPINHCYKKVFLII